MLIQPPEHQPPPFLFSPCLTLNCKLTAGEEIEPASHGHTPECDFTQDLATQLCCSLGFPTVPRSHHTQPMSQACGHLLKKPILGAQETWQCSTQWEQGGAAPQVPSVGVPWDALPGLTFPPLITNWQGHLSEGDQQIYSGTSLLEVIHNIANSVCQT